MTRFFWRRFIGVWFVAFLSLQLTRLVFYGNLRNYFEADASLILDAFLFGFRFDAVSIAYLLGPVFIAIPFIKTIRSIKLIKWYLLIMLGAMNFLNCTDAEFFKFTARRSTDDLFEFAFLSNDIINIAPNLISHFWYLLVAFIIILLLTYWISNKVFNEDAVPTTNAVSWLALATTGIALIIAARGGIQPIPLAIIDAANTDYPHLNAVALSTPFTILKTIGKPELAHYDFQTEEIYELDPIRSEQKTPYSGRLKGNNVVVLIVESLSVEYIRSLNGLGNGYTPFIDSLIPNSMLFENAFSNGHRSIEGIAAVTSSIPTLMYEPYTTSPYAENQINSLASLLRKEGYYTTFMHGGNKNSMNFESFAKQAGYDLFYDRDNYPLSNEHYDGVWGISDHYMLKHCVDKYSEYKKPFFSTIFTLSSHHPYTIPKNYQNRFPKGNLPIHESIGYTDESLREFFINASKTDWFDNTLFVITADHTSLSEYPQFQTKLGSLKIPIILFHPSDPCFVGKQKNVTQQVDIMPTVLDLLGYDKPYFSFGVNALDEHAEHIAVAFKHDQHQLYRNGSIICFDGENTNFVYNVATDLMLRTNLVNDNDFDHVDNEAYLKGYLLNYSKALNRNQMTYNTWTEDSR